MEKINVSLSDPVKVQMPWYIENKEQHKTNCRKWQQQHPEKCKEYCKNWRINNKEKYNEICKINQRKYDAKKREEKKLIKNQEIIKNAD